MTLSSKHEVLVDEVRECFNGWIIEHNINLLDGAMMIIETCMLTPLIGGFSFHRRADGYIQLGDGYTFMALEIGSMAANKWENILDVTDNKPIRVLRIDIDGRYAYLLHARNTQREVSFMDCLNKQLCMKLDERIRNPL